MYFKIRSSSSEKIVSKSNEPLFKAISFEESFAFFLFAKEDFIKNVKIIDKTNITNFFNINDTDFDLKSIKKDEAIIKYMMLLHLYYHTIHRIH